MLVSSTHSILDDIFNSSISIGSMVPIFSEMSNHEAFPLPPPLVRIRFFSDVNLASYGSSLKRLLEAISLLRGGRSRTGSLTISLYKGATDRTGRESLCLLVGKVERRGSGRAAALGSEEKAEAGGTALPLCSKAAVVVALWLVDQSRTQDGEELFLQEL